MNFTVIGNDARMDYVAKQLYSLGCDVSRELSSKSKDICLVLPPPVSEESYYHIKPYLSNILIIYGGCISEAFKALVKDNIPVFDYLNWDNVVACNAMLTARGIIKEAYLANAKLGNSKVLVTGFGYCGKAICRQLKINEAAVTVAVRNHKLKHEIIGEGFDFMGIKDLSDSDITRFNYVFNTVPALVINRQLIDRLNSSVMIFDIASKPGGVDFDYCREKGIFSLLSLGIPGKEYPKEAGELIGMACYEHYNSYK